MIAISQAGFREYIASANGGTKSAGAHAPAYAAMLNPYSKFGDTENKVATLNNAKSNTAFLLTFAQPTIAPTAPSPVETLLDVDAYDEAAAGVVTRRYSRRGMIYPD